MVEKLQNLIRRVEAQKGSIALFMLWKDAPEVEKWTMVVSAPWLDRLNQRVALEYWMRALQGALNQTELNTISRISIIKTNDRFVQFLTRTINVSGGAVRFSRNQVGNYYINDAVIFEAKNAGGAKRMVGLVNRNPAINGSINPNINGSISPLINGSINPAINGSINPNINGSISPNINGALNPNINGAVNPHINGSINPNINGALNPNINGAINPFLNPNFAGLVLYDRSSLNRTSYFVDASDSILLMFNFSNEFIGFCVKADKDFYNVFDTSNTWIGYLVSNKQNGYNYFSTNTQWLGFVV